MQRLLLSILFIFSLGVIKPSYAQVNADDLKSAYLLKIAGNFEWEASKAPIKIGVLSNKREFLLKLTNYSNNRKIGDRKIVVTPIPSAKKIIEYDIIYIGEEKNKNLEDYVNQIGKQKKLLFTDHAKDMKNSMVNFYLTYDKKLKFNINSNLLRLHLFEPSNLMLILGGSDYDILNLLEEKDSSITLERKRALQLKKENKNSDRKLSKLKENMSNISDSLDSKNKEVQSKSEEINKINGKLGLQKDYLKSISKKIHETSAKLSEKEKQISQQENKITEQLQVFENQKNEISLRNEKILEQDGILEQQENSLNLKQRYLNYAYIFSLILLGILVFAVISFLGKRKSSRKLTLQNERLQKALQDLQTAQAKLVQNEKMASLGMVTAGMAHEINNPMTFVYTGVSILKSEVSELQQLLSEILEISESNLSQLEKQKQIQQKINISTAENESINQTICDIELGAKRVTEIIQSLQNFSRLNESDVKTIDIKKSINSTLTILGSHARNKKVNIISNFDDSPAKIECFPASINQVFVNLISNAIDATDSEGGEIIIDINDTEENYQIHIKDNGKGIKQEDIGRIFDPFFTTKSIGKGTGLGLSISYNIIKKHLGNISVSSEVGIGTNFTIDIPKQYSNPS